MSDAGRSNFSAANLANVVCHGLQSRIAHSFIVQPGLQFTLEMNRIAVHTGNVHGVGNTNLEVHVAPLYRSSSKDDLLKQVPVILLKTNPGALGMARAKQHNSIA